MSSASLAGGFGHYKAPGSQEQLQSTHLEINE